MINLKQLITESTKNIKMTFKGNGKHTQTVQFLFHINNDTFVLLPKTATELDKLETIESEYFNYSPGVVVETMLEFLKKKSKIKFRPHTSYSGAGYGFQVVLDDIFDKIK